MRALLPRVILAALLSGSLSAAFAQTQADLFNDATLNDVRITMNPADWQTLKQNYLANTYYPANWQWRNITLENIAIRSRGTGSRSPVKPGLRVDFDRDDPSQTFLGLKSVIMRNNSQDPSMMHEILSLKLFTRLGLPASREAFVRFFVNNEYIGLYTVIESVDKAFLRRTLNDDEGFLYKYDYNPGDQPYYYEYRGADPKLYSPSPFKLETNEDHPNPASLEAWIRTMNNSSGPGFEQALLPYLNIRQFIDHVAIEQSLSDEDGVLGDFGTNNYYLYRYSTNNFHRFLVWDKSNTFRGLDRDIMRNVNQFVPMKKVLEVPELKTYFLQKVLDAARSAAEGNWLRNQIDAFYSLVQQAAYADVNKQCQGADGLPRSCSNAEFDAEVNFMRSYAEGRLGRVEAQVAANGLQVGTPVMTAVFPSSGLRFGIIAGAGAPASLTVALSAQTPNTQNFAASVSSGATWLTVSPASGSTPATLTFSVNPGALSSGDYSATVTVTSGSGAATLTIPVSFSILSAGSEPRLPNGGAVDAADNQGTLAPGALVSIYGQGLAATTAGAASLPLPTEVAGASITVNGVLAPILFASAGQVNIQIPWETPPGSATIAARFKGVTGNSIAATVGQFAPGIFVTVYPDGSLTTGRPAAAGDILVIYANGLGPVSPAVTTGVASPGTPATTTTNPTVTFGGVNAEVLFSGLTPGLAGLYQVNVRVPAGFVTGANTPVVLSIGGRSSAPKPVTTR